MTRLWSYKQRRPVLLAFLHGANCRTCRSWLNGLLAHRGRLDELDAAVLVVAPDPIEHLRDLQVEVDGPWVFLSDVDGSAARAYMPAEQEHRGVGLFAGDRYLECVGAWSATEANGFPAFDAPLTSLLAADLEDCGCGLPIWPESQFRGQD